VTKRQDAGDVIESLPNTLLDHGNSTAKGVKQQTSKLLEDLNNFIPRKQDNGALCSVRRLLDSLPEPERNKLEELLENKSVLSTHLSVLLKNNGYNISCQSLGRHRRRKSGSGCTCK